MIVSFAFAILLAGEPIRLGPGARIEFTERQLHATSPLTRAGLVRWMASERGRAIFRHLDTDEFRVVVVEDESEPGEGRAPQPGIGTFAAMSDPAALKEFELILNPTPRRLPEGVAVLYGHPATATDFMTLAWAGEMLHVEFYARGIVLPHHGRRDFQDEWLEVTAQLGFTGVMHGIERRELFGR